MILKKAVKDDFDRIKEFYVYVIENTETMKDCCRWVYGLHPDDELIGGYIDSGDMYYSERDGKIVAVIAVTKKQEDYYHDIPWQKELSDDEVAVGHIMCCDPALKRQGLAKDMLKSVCELCRGLGKRLTDLIHWRQIFLHRHCMIHLDISVLQKSTGMRAIPDGLTSFCMKCYYEV